MLVEKRCGGAKEVAYLGKPVEIRLDLNGYWRSKFGKYGGEIMKPPGTVHHRTISYRQNRILFDHIHTQGSIETIKVTYQKKRYMKIKKLGGLTNHEVQLRLPEAVLRKKRILLETKSQYFWLKYWNGSTKIWETAAIRTAKSNIIL
jgi:hypothetical protein